jgi:hypothetical protein
MAFVVATMLVLMMPARVLARIAWHLARVPRPLRPIARPLIVAAVWFCALSLVPVWLLSGILDRMLPRGGGAAGEGPSGAAGVLDGRG